MGLPSDSILQRQSFLAFRMALPFHCQVSDEQALPREDPQLKELRHEAIRFFKVFATGFSVLES